jgi:hypothetical protein
MMKAMTIAFRAPPHTAVNGPSPASRDRHRGPRRGAITGRGRQTFAEPRWLGRARADRHRRSHFIRAGCCSGGNAVPADRPR